MRKDHRSQPSGSDKQKGSGIKPVLSAENLEGSDEMTKKYAKDEDQLAEKLKVRHPYRNRTKGNSTDTGGYQH